MVLVKVKGTLYTVYIHYPYYSCSLTRNNRRLIETPSLVVGMKLSGVKSDTVVHENNDKNIITKRHFWTAQFESFRLRRRKQTDNGDNNKTLKIIIVSMRHYVLPTKPPLISRTQRKEKKIITSVVKGSRLRKRITAVVTFLISSETVYFDPFGNPRRRVGKFHIAVVMKIFITIFFGEHFQKVEEVKIFYSAGYNDFRQCDIHTTTTNRYENIDKKLFLRIKSPWGASAITSPGQMGYWIVYLKIKSNGFGIACHITILVEDQCDTYNEYRTIVTFMP